MAVYLDLEVVIGELSALGFVVRDQGLLGSALSRPQTTVFGVDAYPSISLKAASQTESLVQHHALLDGNKRAAWYLLVAFMLINKFQIQAREDDVIKLMRQITSQKTNLPEIANWIAERSKPII